MWMMLQADTPLDFVVATGVSHSVEYLLQTAFGCVGLDYKDFVHVDNALLRPAEVDYLCGDATRARKAFGWEPTTTFEQLIAMMVDADLERNRLNPKTLHFVAGM
jgi:GDPmannose 4,6-dehydratase